MDGNTLNILTILLTVVFGVPAYLALRKKPKTRIFFFMKQQLKLYDDLTKNIPGLEVTYKGNSIQSTMFFFKGIFICSGENDIKKADIDKGITLTIRGKDALWHSFALIKKTQDLKLKASSSGAALTIDFPLLKDKDYFVLEALGESERLYIDITHRIGNVPAVEENILGIEKVIKRELLFNALTIIGLISILFFFFSEIKEYSLETIYYNSKREVVYKHNSELFSLDSAGINEAWVHEDSLSKLARKEQSIFQLISDNTKLYRATPNYYIGFKLVWSWGFLLLLAPLIMLIPFVINLIKQIKDYRRYMVVASLASKYIN